MKGHNTDPWGTPDITAEKSEHVPFKTTQVLLPASEISSNPFYQILFKANWCKLCHR